MKRILLLIILINVIVNFSFSQVYKFEKDNFWYWIGGRVVDSNGIPEKYSFCKMTIIEKECFYRSDNSIDTSQTEYQYDSTGRILKQSLYYDKIKSVYGLIVTYNYKNGYLVSKEYEEDFRPKWFSTALYDYTKYKGKKDIVKYDFNRISSIERIIDDNTVERWKFNYGMYFYDENSKMYIFHKVSDIPLDFKGDYIDKIISEIEIRDKKKKLIYRVLYSYILQ